MTAMTPQQTELKAAAEALVAAFARHDRDAYFAAFAPEATFLFHNVESLLPNRAAYEELWDEWENRDGFRVLACQSSDAVYNVHGDIGIMTHKVATTARFGSDEASSRERETIVFALRDGRWLAIHEHLSLDA